MFATGDTVGLAEWIIDDTSLVYTGYSMIKMNNLRLLLYSASIYSFSGKF